MEFEFKEKYNIDDYRRIIALLRAPDGCPWDKVQTHESVRDNVIEEAYETAQAIDRADDANLCEELGDLLMQVLFHAQMAAERGAFDFDDVCDMACKKLVFRHPHVFGTAEADTPDAVLDTWDAAKRREKHQETVTSAMTDVAETLPALWRARKEQKKAAKVAFDWPDERGAMAKLHEEVGELQEGIDAGDRENQFEEVGDVLFTAVNAARFLDVDPEKALHAACEKFIRRFKYTEEHAAAEGKQLENMTLEEIETLYQHARHDLEGKEMVL